LTGPSLLAIIADIPGAKIYGKEIAMPQVAIVTDTICCLPPELVKQYSIQILPVSLVINRKNYLDTQISNEEFWALFASTKEPITTNAANPSDFEAIFTKLAAGSSGICCILVSGKLSSTCNAAIKTAEKLKMKLPGFPIEVIDSTTATGAQGYIVLEAAKAARAGKNTAEVSEVARAMIPRVKFVTAMNTLKYLIRSGRAPKSALIGDWLKIKPLIGMVSGTGLVDSLGRERGMEKAVQKIVALVGEYTGADRSLHIMVHYTDDKSAADKIKDMMLAKYKCVEVYITPYTPVMASQTGPVVAVAFYPD
jgi:DegV family protein with EDD domain